MSWYYLIKYIHRKLCHGIILKIKYIHKVMQWYYLIKYIHRKSCNGII